MENETRILGIDPGSHVAGFACISSRGAFSFQKGRVQLVDMGVIRFPKAEGALQRLGLLHEAIYELLRELKPHICCIEKPFFGLNASTTIRLGEARGAIIAAVKRQNIAITEVTPASVKKTIAGSGQASKEQVKRGAEALMGIKLSDAPFDASDALAIALYQSLQVSLSQALGQQKQGPFTSPL